MPTQINGLPAHVLLIHVIVILIPLGALFTVLSAVWPAAHRKLGFLSPLACLIALVFVPITTNAGEWLEERLTQNGENAAIKKHADLGDTFLWFALVLFLVSAAVWWLGRQYRWSVLPGRGEPTEPSSDAPAGSGGTLLAERTQAQKQALAAWAGPVIGVVTTVVAVLVVVQLYRIGDSGATATYGYVKDLK